MNKTQQQTKEWQFYKITVACVGKEPMVGIINEYIDNAINEMANTGTGIYSNETTVKKEDEELGALLRANAFDVKESLVFYHNELEKQGVIGEGCLLDDEKAKILFYTLGKIVERIQCDNTNPMRLRNDLAEIIAEFDKMPIMGIMFQILLLQGVAIMLERLKIDEGDSGFDEALSLYNWIMEFLGKKEIRFCFMPYGENDKQLLKPFCDYLMSTDIGKAVQSSVFKSDIETEEPQTTPTEEQETPSTVEEQEKPCQQPKKKGRRVKPFKDKMIDDADGKKLQKIHSVMSGKTGKDAILIVYASFNKGWVMPKPSYTAVTEEFGAVVSKSEYDEYWKNAENKFTKQEIDGIKKILAIEEGENRS